MFTTGSTWKGCINRVYYQVQDKRSIIEFIRSMNSRLNMSGILMYYGIDFDGEDMDRYKVLCPFHNDHTPSLHVITDNESGQDSWVCYVCNENGDCFRFLQRMTTTHQEAVEHAQEIIASIGAGYAANPAYQKALEQRKQKKKAEEIIYRLGVKYREWLDSIKDKPFHKQACKKVETIFYDLTLLMEAKQYEETTARVREKARLLQVIITGNKQDG